MLVERGYTIHATLRNLACGPLLFKNILDAAAVGVKSIAKSFMRSQTVRKLIYTTIVVVASPLKEDGSNFKDSTNDDCWAPIGISFAYSNDMLADYVSSKTLTEKEALSYNEKVNGEAVLEVVTLYRENDNELHKEIKANSFGDITHASRMSAMTVAIINKNPAKEGGAATPMWVSRWQSDTAVTGDVQWPSLLQPQRRGWFLGHPSQS
ncbi:hypothetical protein Syun_019424 [Stephania yunnanensis]|uniref:NAD(P)-binding domain-containing protein n=1 Tax=Stephania yunnanensis TaxID=152371 RepID=A0AAP0NVX0_9MAGN